MIFSKEKSDDMELRSIYLDIMEVAGRMYKKTKEKKYLDYLKFFGNESKKLKDQIDHGDYKDREERRNKIDKVINFKLK